MRHSNTGKAEQKKPQEHAVGDTADNTVENSRANASHISEKERQLKLERRWFIVLLSLVIIETILITMALVPAQLWTRLLPQFADAAQDGPFPALLAPLITALIYFTPTAIGWLCKSWQRALLFATLPAWIGLGLFIVAATSKVGSFYLISSEHVTANVSVLELFAALGAIGWLGRQLFKLR